MIKIDLGASLSFVKDFRVPLLLVMFGLSACASPAEVQNMVVVPPELPAKVSSSPYSAAIEVTRVYGGEETNPLWTSEVSNAAFREALRESLQRSGLLASSAPPQFSLTASLKELDQPLVGFSLTVNSKVDYQLVEKSTMKSVFNEPVQASYTATFGDSPIAIQRLRLANEGSIRENISQFLTRLIDSAPMQ